MDVEDALLLLRNQTESDNLEDINVLRICLSKYHKDIKYQCDICKNIAFVNFGKFMDHYTIEHRVFLYIKDNDWGLMSLYKYNSTHKEVGSHNFSNKEYYKNRQPKAFVYFSKDFELRFKCNICDNHDFFTFEEVLKHFCSSHSHSFDFENEWVYLILNIKDDKSFKIDVFKDNSRRIRLSDERRGSPRHTEPIVKHSERALNPLELFDNNTDFRNHNDFSNEARYKPNISIFGSREPQIGKNEPVGFEDKIQNRCFPIRNERVPESYSNISITKTFSRKQEEEKNTFENIRLERKTLCFTPYIQGEGVPEKLLDPNIRSPVKRNMGFVKENSPQRKLFTKTYSSISPNTNVSKNYRNNPFKIGDNATEEFNTVHGPHSYKSNTAFGRRSEYLPENLPSSNSIISNRNKEKLDRSDVLARDREITFTDHLSNRLLEKRMPIRLENQSKIVGVKFNDSPAGGRENFQTKFYAEVSPRELEKSDRGNFSKAGPQNPFSKNFPRALDNPSTRLTEKSLQFHKYHYTNPSFNERERNVFNQTQEKFNVPTDEIAQNRGGAMNQLPSRMTNSSNGDISSTFPNRNFKRAKLENDYINSSASDVVVKKGYDDSITAKNFSDDDEATCNTSKHPENSFNSNDEELFPDEDEELFPEEDDVLTVANIQYTLYTYFGFECILCTEIFKSLLHYMNHLRVSHKTIFLPDDRSIIKLYLYSEDISTIQEDFVTKLETRAKVFDRRTRKKAELRQQLNTDRSQLPKAIQFRGDWIELAIIYYNTKTELLNFRCDVCFESGYKSLKKFVGHVFVHHPSCLSYEINGPTKTGNLVLSLNNITKFPLDIKTRERELKKFRTRELRRTESNLIHSRITNRGK